MMLDIDFVELRRGFLQYLPIGALVGFILLIELLLVVGSWFIAPEATGVLGAPAPAFSEVHNTRALGQIIYTQYVYLFQAAGMVLLVAMIGAIVLTLRHNPNVKRQVIRNQVARKREDAVEMKKVEPGQGL